MKNTRLRAIDENRLAIAPSSGSGVDLTLIRWMLSLSPLRGWACCKTRLHRFISCEMLEKAPDFKRILEILVAHGVEFVVVGGVGAVLQGAPIATFDLDIVHSRSPKNLERLLTALKELGSFYRSQPDRKLQPGGTHLRTTGHQLLMTDFGPLDVLGAVGLSREYPELINQAEVFEVGQLRFHVLNLETLIQLKEEVGQSKDRAVLEVLRAVRDERDSGEEC